MVARRRLPNGNGHTNGHDDPHFNPRSVGFGNQNRHGDGSVYRSRRVLEPHEEGTRGRKSLFREEYVDQARKLAEMGHTDCEIAMFFGVSESTFKYWKFRFPALSEAMKVGKDIADDRVERALYTKAVGFYVDTEKVFCSEGGIVRAKTKQYYPPDTAAAFIWLKNRRGWTDRARVEFTPGPDSFVDQLRERLDKLEVPKEVTLGPSDYKRVA